MNSQAHFKTNWEEAKTNYKLPTRGRMYKESFRVSSSDKSMTIKYGELESEGMGEVVKRLSKYFGVKDWELLGVMDHLSGWRKEIKDYYNKKNWFLYEWYYPIQTSILKKIKNKRTI